VAAVTDDATVIELRRMFPVVEHWTYLYNGSIHPLAMPVSEAMNNAVEECSRGGEDAFHLGHERFLLLKERLAQLLHTQPSNMVITDSTTAGLNLAAQILAPQHDQNVVLTDLAFMSSTYPWLASGAAIPDVRFVEQHNGRVLLGDIEAAIDPLTACVSICAVTVGSGYRFDLPRLADMTRAAGVPLIVDAAQALGLIDIDVNATPVDFLAGTTSKWLMGPTGIGYLYVADQHLGATPPSVGWMSAANVDQWDVRNVELHDDAGRFQGGIPNLVGIAGALAGIELLNEIGRPFIESRVRELTRYLLGRLDRLGLDIWTPMADAERAGIVFFRIPDASDVHLELKAERIYCGSFLDGIRCDPTFYNTPEELDRFLAVIERRARSSR
jgi:selenocysteine lyase/cysteine desulfurase